MDLAGVAMRDLVALEGYMERALARGDMAADWESSLPARLRKILREAELGQPAPSPFIAEMGLSESPAGALLPLGFRTTD